MNTILKKAVGVAAGVALSTAANAAFIPFFIDVDGDGDTSNAISVNEFFDIIGTVDVTSAYTGATTFNFGQTGSFNAVGSDSVPNAALFPITASFTGTGSGDLATGDLAFDAGGNVNIMASGFMIADFVIQGGGGSVDNFGAPNGDSTVVALAQSFVPGYFYLNDGGAVGADLATLDLLTGPGDPSGAPLFGFSTTNLSTVAGTEVFDALGRLESFTAGANGQFRIEEIPAPATLALFGLGLLALGSRRKAA